MHFMDVLFLVHNFEHMEEMWQFVYRRPSEVDINKSGYIIFYVCHFDFFSYYFDDRGGC